MKKLLITLGAFFVVIVLLGIAYKNQGLINKEITYDIPQDQENYVSINGNTIRVELATTIAQKAKGLSERNYLGTNDGMLFDLKNDNPPHTFWMKDMLIPIDIIWINNERIVKINHEVQPPSPNTPDNQLETITVTEKVDYVLEVNTGYANDHGIKEGDSLEIVIN